MNVALSVALTLALTLSWSEAVHAQVLEPEPVDDRSASSPYQKGLKNTRSVVLSANNFGFGIFGEYDRALNPNVEALLRVGVSGLRDVSEQTYTDFFFGQQIIPNKYQRGVSLPLTLGVRHRLFARSVEESYRFHIGASAGPVFAFTYPYFKDYNDNGYRERYYFYYEPVNDVFSGWKDGEWHVGLTGEASIGIDIGKNFTNLTRIQFGYFFYSFRQGIQMMQPQQPADDLVNQDDYIDEVVAMKPFFDDQRFFGTPMLVFSFGRLW